MGRDRMESIQFLQRVSLDDSTEIWVFAEESVDRREEALEAGAAFAQPASAFMEGFGSGAAPRASLTGTRRRTPGRRCPVGCPLRDLWRAGREARCW
jgi:hypothetical protein